MLVQFIEFLVVWWLLALFVPEGLPFVVGVLILVGWGTLTFAFNLWIRRRIIPPGSAGDPLGPDAASR